MHTNAGYIFSPSTETGMATTTGFGSPTRDSSAITRGALLGILAGVVFGILIQFRLERMTAIGAMYTLGDPQLSVGWIAHLGHSALFGALYGLLVDRELFDRVATRPLTGLLLGGGYGVALWAINIVVIWPLWLGAVGVSNAPSFPFLTVLPLFGHLVYGGLTGLLFGAIQR
ncbi:MAG: hypothetical protein ACI9EZ_002079 [Halobacteriales archaeon]|jgi:hypothetical protein